MLFTSSTINERKNRAKTALDTVLNDGEVVLVHSGTPIQKPGGHDQTYPFLPHPDYFWITGVRRPEGICAYSKSEGWVEFVRPVTKDEKVWEGGTVDVPGKDIATFEPWLKNKNFKKVYHLGQHPSSLSINPADDHQRILAVYNDVRRVKDKAEVELIRNLAMMANAGYRSLKTFIRPGVSEREIQLEYEMSVLKAGAEKMPYDSIVGTGTNSAVLHAIPTPRIVQHGEMVLIDAGADIQDYCVDITRVFAASGKLDSQQQAVFGIVLKAQKASIELMRPGVEWKDVHLASARVIASGLRELGILKCGVEQSLENESIALFFPHGVGHMVGLKVRDVGGPFNPHPKKYAGARLRVDMPLKEGHLMTVEPGMYFIQALLNDDDTRKKFAHEINWSEVDKWMNVGGVRLEDDMLVTNTGTENLTSIVEK